MPHSKGFHGRKDARSADPVAIGDVVDNLLAEDVFARGMPVAKLVANWPALVGDRLAAETAPLTLEGGVLTVGATSGPWGAQARFLHQEICRRTNEALGGDAVRSVRVVVRNPS
jgi:hypothetical protein